MIDRVSRQIAKVIKFSDGCVLCWLATADKKGQPNVSPKEIFNLLSDGRLLIANISSPNSVHNIRENPNVCVSMLNVFTQKGWKISGESQIIEPANPDFEALRKELIHMENFRFKLNSIIVVEVSSIAEILAPSYQFFKDTKESQMITSAKKQYEQTIPKGIVD